MEWPQSPAPGASIDAVGRVEGIPTGSPSLLFTSDESLDWLHLVDGDGASLYGTLPAMATAAFTGSGECRVEVTDPIGD